MSCGAPPGPCQSFRERAREEWGLCHGVRWHWAAEECGSGPSISRKPDARWQLSVLVQHMTLELIATGLPTPFPPAALAGVVMDAEGADNSG